jgi:hypothetical protein
MKKLRELYKQLLIGEKPDLALWMTPIIGLLLLFVLPFILTRPGPDILNYTQTGQIGDTIGGIAGPVIALLAALLTFFAFWVQFQANKAQTAQFNKQDVDTKIDRFENRFYELIKLHRENVAEMVIADSTFGRKAFVTMFKEFKFAYHALKLVYKSERKLKRISNDLTEEDFINISFIIFLMGVGETSDKLTQDLIRQYEHPLIVSYIDLLKKCQIFHGSDGKVQIETGKEEKVHYELSLNYKPFDGHLSRLGHYFRHLYQTVKFVVEQDDNVINNKYEYLKTLRAQLSTHEQLLLYYNGLTILGKSWIDNKYFTKYRMIKNLPLPLADFGVLPKNKLGERNEHNELLFEWDEVTTATNLQDN